MHLLLTRCWLLTENTTVLLATSQIPTTYPLLLKYFYLLFVIACLNTGEILIKANRFVTVELKMYKVLKDTEE